MKSARAVCVSIFLLSLCSLVYGQTVVDVRVYTPPRSGAEAVVPDRGESGGSPDLSLPGRAPLGGSRPIRRLKLGRGAGGAEPTTPPRQVRRIYVKKHTVDVRIIDGVSVTEIDQTFHNEFGRRMEGTYVCPLPENAVVSGFSIYMAGKEVHGIVMDLDRGRSIYEKIVRKARDPGLVEMIRKGTPMIRTRIFPIPARGDFRVKTRYAHVMSWAKDRYLTRVPLKALASNGAPPIASLKLTFESLSTWPVRHSVTRDYAFRAGRFQASEFTPKRDLEIGSVASRRTPGLALHVQTTATGERYFMAVVAAGKRTLMNPVLALEGIDTEDVYPKRIRTLPADRQTVVFGKLIGRGAPVGTLRARSGGRDVALRSSMSRGTANDFVAGLWAVNRVRDILASSRTAEIGSESKRKIVALAARFGILTPYTAILAK